MPAPPVLALVVPCFNESGLIESTHKILKKKLKQLAKDKLIDPQSFCCYIDDGSRDETWAKIKKITGKDCHAIKLSFNTGQQNALLAGIRYIVDKVDCCITIDSDLQDDIEVIPEMLKHYTAGKDVVYGVRNDRSSDSFFKRTLANLYYLISPLLGVVGIPNHAEYRLMSKKTLEIVAKFNEYHMYLRGIVFSLDLPSAKVYYTRKPRISGESQYTLVKLCTLALNGITSFSIVPLRIITFLGFLCCFGSIIYTLIVLAGYDANNPVPGWTSLIVSLYFLGGLIMLSLGVVGEYIGKIFLEAKKRPIYVVEEVVNPDDATD